MAFILIGLFVVLCDDLFLFYLLVFGGNRMLRDNLITYRIKL